MAEVLTRYGVFLPAPTRPNERWSMDFVSVRMVHGRCFRTPTVMSIYTRESLAPVADGPYGRRLGRADAAGAMPCRNRDHVKSRRRVRPDALDAWTYVHGERPEFIRRTPVENAFMETDFAAATGGVSRASHAVADWVAGFRYCRCEPQKRRHPTRKRPSWVSTPRITVSAFGQVIPFVWSNTSQSFRRSICPPTSIHAMRRSRGSLLERQLSRDTSAWSSPRCRNQNLGWPAVWTTRSCADLHTRAQGTLDRGRPRSNRGLRTRVAEDGRPATGRQRAKTMREASFLHTLGWLGERREAACGSQLNLQLPTLAWQRYHSSAPRVDRRTS
jgi:hypothetical protein